MEDAFLIIFFFSLLFCSYFFPTIVAEIRKHPSIPAIFVFNLLLGLTGVFWVLALVWACTNPYPNNVDVVVKNDTSHGGADEIKKLADLKKNGLLTEEEFNQKKQQIFKEQQQQHG